MWDFTILKIEDVPYHLKNTINLIHIGIMENLNPINFYANNLHMIYKKQKNIIMILKRF